MSRYVHKSLDGVVLPFPVGKAVCIGQNYADHIAELNSIQRPEPLFFIKANHCFAPLSSNIFIPRYQGECHNELEVAVLISKKLSKNNEQQVKQAIWGYGLALDLTLRKVQARQKKQGRPWEVAKAFDHSLPLSQFVPSQSISLPIDFSLTINGIQKQSGNTNQMIRPIYQLIAEMSQHFTLYPGDVVLTGTPAGVGPLKSGDKLISTFKNNSDTVLTAKTQIL